MLYRDTMDGKLRVKRRYKWAFWAFALGFIAGVMLPSSF